MKRYIYTISVIIFIQCSVDIRQVPVYEEIKNVKRNSENIAVLDNVLINGYSKDYLKPIFRILSSKVLKDTFYFQNVYTDERDFENKEHNYYKIDLRYTMKYSEYYKWVFSWPALWPLTGYWPIQHRFGNYHLTIEYLIKNKENEILNQNTCEISNQENIKIYGFYRTKPFEDMIANTNLDGMKKCSLNIVKFIQSL